MIKKSDKPILVIEDDEFIRQNIIEVLESEGYKAFGLSNGQEALDYLKNAESLPCLVLLDLMMPLMDGWQFRIEQKRDKRLAQIPIVVVTADGNAREKAEKINAEGWVKKPIEIDDLLQVVKRYCDG